MKAELFVNVHSVLCNHKLNQYTVAFFCNQDSRNFYLLDVYADCDNEREEEIQVWLWDKISLNNQQFLQKKTFLPII